jgi:hypothetical protein
MGWAASFVGLHDFGVHSMDGYSNVTAWFVPATFDGAAFGTTLITYRASINGRGAFRARVLMWAFTAVSSWINWVHQPTGRAQIVAAGLPIAAVAVFDVVMLEMRGDYEARHGRRAFRMRPGLLILRWLVDRAGTTEAFRGQIRSIPVASLAGLGSDLVKLRTEALDAAEVRTEPAGPPTTRPAWPRTEESSSLSAAPQPWPASWPQPQGRDQPLAHIANGAVTTSAAEVNQFAERAKPAGDTTEAPANTPASPPTEPTADVDLAQTRTPEQPAEQTVVMPAVSASAAREAAREQVRNALTAGHEPPAGEELAGRYGRTKRWARDQVRAVRQELEQDSRRQLLGADRGR